LIAVKHADRVRQRAGGTAMSLALRSDGMLRRTPPFFRLAAAVWIAAAALSLGGCGSISEKMSASIGSMPGVGLPANAPERPSEQRAYPAVHDMPPQRTTAVLSADEQRIMQRELATALAEQKAAAAAPTAFEAAPAPAAPPPAAKPAAAARKKPAPKPQAAPASASIPAPAPSSRVIY
jgi:hypothetical protein